MFEMIVQNSPIFAQSLSMVDWAMSLALAHPKLANFLLHPNSCIWPWVWHRVWHLKARRKSYKDAVTSRWATRATAYARDPRGAWVRRQRAVLDITNIKRKLTDTTYIFQARDRGVTDLRQHLLWQLKCDMRILSGQLRVIQVMYEHNEHSSSFTENEFLFGKCSALMLTPKEHYRMMQKDMRKMNTDYKRMRRSTNAENEAHLLLLDDLLLQVERTFKRYDTECTENKFYKRLRHTMLPSKERGKKNTGKRKRKKATKC